MLIPWEVRLISTHVVEQKLCVYFLVYLRFTFKIKNTRKMFYDSGLGFILSSQCNRAINQVSAKTKHSSYFIYVIIACILTRNSNVSSDASARKGGIHLRNVSRAL